MASSKPSSFPKTDGSAIGSGLVLLLFGSGLVLATADVQVQHAEHLGIHVLRRSPTRFQLQRRSHRTAARYIENHREYSGIIGNYWESLGIIGNHWESLGIILDARKFGPFCYFVRMPRLKRKLEKRCSAHVLDWLLVWKSIAQQVDTS